MKNPGAILPASRQHNYVVLILALACLAGLWGVLSYYNRKKLLKDASPTSPLPEEQSPEKNKELPPEEELFNMFHFYNKPAEAIVFSEKSIKKIEQLLNKKPKFDAKNNKGDTLLYLLYRYGPAVIVNKVLENSTLPSFNQQDQGNGDTLLHGLFRNVQFMQASVTRNQLLYEKLKHDELDFSIQNKEGKTALDVLIKHPNHLLLADFIRVNEDTFSEAQKKFITTYLLNEQAAHTIIPLLKILDFSQVFTIGNNNVAHLVCTKSLKDFQTILKNYPALLLMTNNYGKTPIHCLCGNQESPPPLFIEKLLESDESLLKTLTIQDKQGRNPLHLLCSNSAFVDLAFIGTLLQCRKLPAQALIAQDENGDTPLHYLLCRWDEELSFDMVKIFIEYSIDSFHVQNKQGKIPFHMLCKKMNLNEEQIALLAKAGANFNLPDQEGEIPLYMLWRKITKGLIKTLAEAWTDFSKKDLHNENLLMKMTALSRSISEKNVKLIMETAQYYINPWQYIHETAQKALMQYYAKQLNKDSPPVSDSIKNQILSSVIIGYLFAKPEEEKKFTTLLEKYAQEAFEKVKVFKKRVEERNIDLEAYLKEQLLREENIPKQSALPEIELGAGSNLLSTTYIPLLSPQKLEIKPQVIHNLYNNIERLIGFLKML